MKLIQILLMVGPVLGALEKMIEVNGLGEVSIKNEMEEALDALYGRRLVGWAAERSNYSYACINETWWSETVERDATINDEYLSEREFFSKLSIDEDLDDDYIPQSHPPHHPHPHHPHPHHPHCELAISEDNDDYIPSAHPPHHPHPHHPHPHHPHRELTIATDQDDYIPSAHPPHHPHPHHPHPHHPHRELTIATDQDDYIPSAHPPHHPHPHHPHPHHPHRELTIATDQDDYIPSAHPPHHPHPHHPHPHHPHRELSISADQDDDDFVPSAHPPHHPHPHHPHHPHPHGHWELVYADESNGVLETTWEGCCEPDGYGELSRDSVDGLAEALGLSKENPTKSFYDLGSGVGKIVLHAVVAGFAETSVGVELNDGRYRAALAMRNDIVAKDMPEITDRVQFFNGDMLDADLSKATLIYMNHACYPEDVRAKIADKLLATAHSAEIIVAAPTIPQLEASGRFKAEPGFLLLPMELYTYGTPLKIYRRIAQDAAV